ncbi:testis-specific serine kinase substrate isoform X1 [Ornithorhynchus anatinus]|uniref:Testis specific serine kinase substrate n=1 Tax=Ornithorhynchus anatinus TaxID=9258 RepID=A0A6I8NEQ8_ORNAN|nr:testis-specific serine kinase substrate isoform X1 [Ornithorhynchus anatinus]
MASVVVKTIWQSKEIHEAGDPPAGADGQAQLGKESPGGAAGAGKGIQKKKKAVSFHGVEPRMSHEPMQWCLNLKRSSACTNVSLLNLASVDLPPDLTDSFLDSGAPAWGPHDPDIADLLNGVNSGLVRAKDSITSLKEKTTRVNHHVQCLQSECSLLSENLERRRQEAEELEGYCCKLKENCQMVTQTVEDAELKTNVLKQNSTLLVEKLRFLKQQIQEEAPTQPEAQPDARPEDQPEGLETTPTPLSFDPAPAPASTPTPSSPQEPPPSGEGPGGGQQLLQKISAELEELRREVSALARRRPAEEGPGQEAVRRLDGFLAQWERAQREQDQAARGLQDLRTRAEELCTMVERSVLSLSSLRSELEGLGHVKPVLEELGRQLAIHRGPPEPPERPPHISCTRCGSQGQQLGSESLQAMLERALAPLLDEVRQKGLPPACPSCQRLHKKILELERQALAKHVRAEALSSTLRLAQDEALRAKNLLLTDKMKPEEKIAALDYLHLKMCSLHEQLSTLPLEGPTGGQGGGSSGGPPLKHGGSNTDQ